MTADITDAITKIYTGGPGGNTSKMTSTVTMKVDTSERVAAMLEGMSDNALDALNKVMATLEENGFVNLDDINSPAGSGVPGERGPPSESDGKPGYFRALSFGTSARVRPGAGGPGEEASGSKPGGGLSRQNSEVTKSRKSRISGSSLTFGGRISTNQSTPRFAHILQATEDAIEKSEGEF